MVESMCGYHSVVQSEVEEIVDVLFAFAFKRVQVVDTEVVIAIAQTKSRCAGGTFNEVGRVEEIEYFLVVDLKEGAVDGVLASCLLGLQSDFLEEVINRSWDQTPLLRFLPKST